MGVRRMRSHDPSASTKAVRFSSIRSRGRKSRSARRRTSVRAWAFGRHSWAADGQHSWGLPEHLWGTHGPRTATHGEAARTYPPPPWPHVK